MSDLICFDVIRANFECHSICSFPGNVEMNNSIGSAYCSRCVPKSVSQKSLWTDSFGLDTKYIEEDTFGMNDDHFAAMHRAFLILKIKLN